MPPYAISVPLKDVDLRTALYAGEIRRHCLREPDSLVIDELGIFEGRIRVDIAVVNRQLHGYEIKSAADTLSRLPAQQASYDMIFDRITLVADEKHVQEAFKILPSHWGLIAVSSIAGKPLLKEIWPARQNPSVDAYALCQLLWRDEALTILKGKGMIAGLWSAPRKKLWRALATKVEINELKQLVRQTLRERKGWR